jgi:hypothetical protein
LLGEIKLVEPHEEVQQDQERATSVQDLAHSPPCGQRVVSTRSAMVTILQSFGYEGDRKNFNFGKYVILHIEQHNQHADLQEYGVAPLAENLKTIWFQDGIKDTSLDAVKVSINANCANFTDFDSVKDAYVEFKHTQAPTHDPKTRQVASVARSGRGGGGHPRQQDRGQEPQTSIKCQEGLVPQAEVDKPTHIVDRHYSPLKDKFQIWQNYFRLQIKLICILYN